MKQKSEYSNSGADLTGMYFRRTDDVDLSEKEWIPVSAAYEGISHQFTGCYDGGGHNISKSK